MTYTERASKAQDRVLSTVKQAEGAVVSAVSTVSERVGAAIPTLPTLPLAGRLPQPKDLVELSFEYWQELLKIQREYALGLLDALAPITGKIMPNGKARKPRKTTAAKAS